MNDPRFDRWRGQAPEREILSAEERARAILAIGRDVERVVQARPDGAEMLRRQEPRPPRAEAWWLELVRRGRASRVHAP